MAIDSPPDLDAELLERFLARRDPSAFAELVRRHGPMVLGVCRRVLHDFHDAEDAFQATFLVLVRKAAAIRRRELLGNWLYGVAYRVARDARAAALRRQVHEAQVNPMPEPEATASPPVECDLRPLLDEELSRLPDRYRVAILLCDLEGRTRQEAARQLGVPVGTLSGRLTTAHRLLARRLARRGVALTAGTLAAISASTALGGVPASLAASVVESAMAVAAGQTAASVVSAKAAALAEGVVKTMLLARLKLLGIVVLAAGVFLGAGLLVSGTEGRDANAPRVIRLENRGRRVLWSPDGKALVVAEIRESLFGRRGSTLKVFDVDKGQARKTLDESEMPGLAFQHVVCSADGSMIAATVTEEVVKPNSLVIQDVVKVWDTRTLQLQHKFGEELTLGALALARDGKHVAAADYNKRTVFLWNTVTGALDHTLKYTGQGKPCALTFSADDQTLLVLALKQDGSGEISLWDRKTGKLVRAREQARLSTPAVFSQDGKLVACTVGGRTVEVLDVEKGDVLAAFDVGEGNFRAPAFSPDGATVAVGCHDGKVQLWDVKTGVRKAVLEGSSEEVHSVAFSPDGTTLASTGQDQKVRLWPMKPR